MRNTYGYRRAVPHPERPAPIILHRSTEVPK